MRRGLSITALLLVFLTSAPGATLERLSLEDMIEKSTAIVRGRVQSYRPLLRGPIIYTLYTVQVDERWKGAEESELEVAVPGGVAQGLHQTFAGAPSLVSGNEYVLFLWRGKSGLTHVIGLSQGLFRVEGDKAYRAASTEAMLDPKTGRIVDDASLRMELGELRSRVMSGVRRRGK